MMQVSYYVRYLSKDDLNHIIDLSSISPEDYLISISKSYSESDDYHEIPSGLAHEMTKSDTIIDYNNNCCVVVDKLCIVKDATVIIFIANHDDYLHYQFKMEDY